MKLHGYFRSGAAYRVRIALNLKGLAYESIPKAFAKNEHRAMDYLALNPQGLIPALEDRGATLSQSLAIIEYLDERFPSPPFLPVDPIDRARVRFAASKTRSSRPSTTTRWKLAATSAGFTVPAART